jgi:uncharacterized membrane protein YphA (DoxX/SURF4 family)
MSENSARSGLVIVRVLIGVFFVSESLIKLHWFGDTSDLAGRFAGYLNGAGPMSRAYLEWLAIPGTALFARLVPLGELGCGLAMVLGVRTRFFAALALLMTLNFHVASGAIFQLGFFTNGYGLPVVGSLLALAVGGDGLPWSVRVPGLTPGSRDPLRGS